MRFEVVTCSEKHLKTISQLGKEMEALKIYGGWNE